MTTMHDMLMETLEKHALSPQATEAIVAIALRHQIPELGQEQAVAAAKQLMEQGTSHISIDTLFPDEERSVRVTPDELERAQQTYMKCVAKATSEVAREAINELALTISNDLKASSPRVLAEIAEEKREFQSNLDFVWGHALSQLELLINAAQEANGLCHQAVLRQLQGKESWRLFALGRLHLRACRTAHEIVTLLRAGFADGASARWRSLHELSVISMFLSEHGEQVARRFVDHQVIEQRRSLREYQRHHCTLADEPIDHNAADEIEKAAKKMLRRYGQGFGKDYGWATKALKAKRVRFCDIEASLDLDYWRPYYLLSCQSIHAGARGCVFSLGSPDDSNIPGGPTIQGLQDPGCNCAHSLVLASVALLTNRPVLDMVVMSQVLSRLAEDVVSEFNKAEQFLVSHLVVVPNEYISTHD